MIRRGLVIGMFALSVSIAPLAHAAEKVEVRGGEHAQGFARIAVEWPKPIAFTAQLDGETLTIHFARAFTAQLAPLQGALSDYVASVGQSADGQSIVAKLKRKVEIKTATVNGRIATVDLVREGGGDGKTSGKTAKASGQTPPQDARPAAAPAKSAAAQTKRQAAKPARERVQLRAAEHAKGFARIAIEWPAPVHVEVRHDGASLTIRFARPFKADLAPMTHDLEHYVSAVKQSADGTTLIATLKRPVEVKSEIVNRRIAAIDLRPSASDAAKPAPARPQSKAPSQAAAAAPPQPPKDEAKGETKAAAEKASSPPTALVPIPPVAASPAPSTAYATAGNPASVANLKPMMIAGDAQTASLRFDWPTQTGAAVYRRGGAVWVVFSEPTTLDLAALRAAGYGIIKAVDQIAAPGATALRIVVADEINPSVRRAGNSWIVDLKRQEGAADAPIVVDPRPALPIPAVELHVHGAGRPLRLHDPLLDDWLTIVPVSDVGRGIDVTHAYVDFRLLPSVQGIVIRPIADDLGVAVTADAVDISRPRGLALSNEHDQLLGGSSPDRHRLFDFAAWRGPAGTDFFTRRSALDRAIAAAPKGARTTPRLDLAHFYFANLLGPETLAVLAQVTRGDPKAAADPSFHALQGAACVLAAIDACAAKELGQASLDNEPEISLWRGSYAAGQGDWAKAEREFLPGLSLLNTYPKALRDRFALQAAESLLETDRASAAGPLLDLIDADNPDLHDAAMAAYLRGRADQQLGKLQAALDLWTKAAAMGDRKARAASLYAKAMALYEAKRADLPTTIKSLDALRFTWRGDRFEFDLLRRLGELKLKNNDIAGGIDALNLATAYFPNYPDAKNLTKEASDAFANLFVGKGAEDMPPVKALALYDEFHNLEPSGPRHDAIVKKLVDRLVAVDLLDRAAGLLDDLVKKEPAGLDKARAATQLALLRLMNHQPDAAIAALDIDIGKDVPPDLARQRQELRARALLDQSRAPQALAVLAKDDSRDAYRLRADIYWHQRDWKNAAKVFALLAGPPPEKGPLGDETAHLVLSWAAALTLDGDQKGLAKLRAEFGPAMEGTKSADAFSIVAGDDGNARKAGGTPNQIADRIAQIGALQNFMASYKQRLANDKLSAIN
jgi:hypothetical protein